MAKIVCESGDRFSLLIFLILPPCSLKNTILNYIFGCHCVRYLTTLPFALPRSEVTGVKGYPL